MQPENITGALNTMFSESNSYMKSGKPDFSFRKKIRFYIFSKLISFVILINKIA